VGEMERLIELNPFLKRAVLIKLTISFVPITIPIIMVLLMRLPMMEILPLEKYTPLDISALLAYLNLPEELERESFWNLILVGLFYYLTIRKI
jgi:hypothetical protein